MLLPRDDEEMDANEKISFSTMLRGGINGNDAFVGEKLPPIPPIKPRHSGSVHYSAVINPDGTTTYRRDVNAPCDYGMLVFNVGPADDSLPFQYDLYEDAYLWSDNSGLCIFYPTYTGYQLGPKPWWTLGVDPTTVNLRDLVADVTHMHRISSRLVIPKHASANSKTIDKDRAGDYIILAHHNFYDINYYKQLKSYVNSWVTKNDTDTKMSHMNINVTTTI